MYSILALSLLVNVKAMKRIVGGRVVTADQYPFIVSVSGACGGSLVRKEYPAVVLTAAHCRYWFSRPNSYVRLNSNDVFGSNSGSFDSAIDRYVIHPNYVSAFDGNDIALLFLTEDISNRNEVTNVELDSHGLGSECCTAGDDLEVIGYGANCFLCASTPTLEALDVDYVNRTVCYNQWNSDDKTITNTMNCAATSESGACHGDSGGPLVRKGTNQQVGIPSFAYDCADPNFADVYADVGVFYDWIMSEIGTPCSFRIKALDANCYLSIGPGSPGQDHDLYNYGIPNRTECDAFWDCSGTSKGRIWQWNNGKLGTTFNSQTYFLEDDWDTGKGFQINSNERNAKVDPGATDIIQLESYQHGTRIIVYTGTNDKLVLQRDYNDFYYVDITGQTVIGCEAKWDFYNHEGAYNRIKLEYESECT